jgi:hypothetical protein
MGLLNTEDAINNAMLNGLSNSFKAELKGFLMEKAEKEVDQIVSIISKRLELKIRQSTSQLSDPRFIKLEWIFRKEN